MNRYDKSREKYIHTCMIRAKEVPKYYYYYSSMFTIKRNKEIEFPFYSFKSKIHLDSSHFFLN